MCDILQVGQVGRAYGIHGWSHIRSFTDPWDNLLDFQEWHLRNADGNWVIAKQVTKKRLRDGIVAKIDEVSDRTHAEHLTGTEIGIASNQLPETAKGEYYWRDLMDLAVENTDGHHLGVVRELIPTGAADVIRVVGETRTRLIPFKEPILKAVEDHQKIIVDWHIDWE